MTDCCNRTITAVNSAPAMDRRVLFFYIYIFQIGNANSKGLWINVTESKEIEGDISTLDRPKRTNALLLAHLNKMKYIVQDKVEQSQEEVCVAPGKKRGRCLPIKDCPHINNYYVIHKEFTCNLNQRSGRAVGVCCLNDITTSEHYNEDTIALFVRKPIVVPPHPVISSFVSVPNTDINRMEGSLESLGKVAGCGFNGKNMSSIVEETRATIRDWPWMAGLIRILDGSGNAMHFCGGAIISRTHILTAAHCFSGGAMEFFIRLGDHNLQILDETLHKDFSVSRMIIHEEYDSITYRHDIALLVLNESITYNTYIQPVCLPPPGPRYEDVTAVVTGWGDTSFEGEASPILLEVPVPVWEQNRCKNSFAQIIYDTCMCAAAYEGGRDSCQGDSGGPLVTQREDGRWEIIGIVSWGNDCGKPNQPGIYTRVNDYLEWIAFNIQ